MPQLTVSTDCVELYNPSAPLCRLVLEDPGSASIERRIVDFARLVSWEEGRVPD